MVATPSISSSSVSTNSQVIASSFVNNVSLQEERRNQLNRAREQLAQLVQRVQRLQIHLAVDEAEESKQATRQLIADVVFQAVNTAERVLQLFELTRI